MRDSTVCTVQKTDAPLFGTENLPMSHIKLATFLLRKPSSRMNNGFPLDYKSKGTMCSLRYYHDRPFLSDLLDRSSSLRARSHPLAPHNNPIRRRCFHLRHLNASGPQQIPHLLGTKQVNMLLVMNHLTDAAISCTAPRDMPLNPFPLVGLMKRCEDQITAPERHNERHFTRLLK